MVVCNARMLASLYVFASLPPVVCLWTASVPLFAKHQISSSLRLWNYRINVV